MEIIFGLLKHTALNQVFTNSTTSTWNAQKSAERMTK